MELCLDQCGGNSGNCTEFCGDVGVCCRAGFKDPKTNFDCKEKGGRDKHRCDFDTGYVFPDEEMVADSHGLKHNGELCWDKCNNQDGPCKYCGTGRCCQEGLATSSGCKG